MIPLFEKLFNRKKTDWAGLMKNGAVIVDVRTPGEYQSGHIQGSRNIPLNILKTKLSELKKLNKPLILVCQSGSRSNMAKSILSGHGLEAYNGGGWSSFQRKL